MCLDRTLFNLCRTSIVLLALVISLCSAGAVDLVQNVQLFGGRCDAVPGGLRAQVTINIADWKPLTDNALIPSVLDSGRDFAMARCPGVRIIAVFVKSATSFPFEIDALWMGGDQCNVTRNNIPQLLQQEEAQRQAAALRTAQ